MTNSWLNWNDVPWFKQNQSCVEMSYAIEKLLATGAESSGVSQFLESALGQLMTELSAQWASIWRCDPEWKEFIETGRPPGHTVSTAIFNDVLDRNEAVLSGADDTSKRPTIACPLPIGEGSSAVLVVAGRNISEQDLSTAFVLTRVISVTCQSVRRTEQKEKSLQRALATLDITSKFTGIHETQPLLELIAEEATGLLQCDRSSIFVWDVPRKEVIACPALGVEDHVLRIPDDKGIVGDVIHSGEAVIVNDAYNDSRFDKSVDKQTGYRTESLLCVPIRNTQDKIIGAFEVMNKKAEAFDEDDVETLAGLGVQVATALKNVQEREALVKDYARLSEEVSGRVQIIGESPAMKSMQATIERLASTDLPVLVLGESGTGKEVVSQSLHYSGARADKPFVAVNCAAISETLLESELFGHEKGAFTDAQDTRQGKFELADGGTLFLDEIGDMSLGGQAKLLRVLEQKVITRVGGSKTIPVDVRVVAATNAKLAESVQEKKFRQDLYYRLSVVTIDIPPLRERPEDVLPLANYFLQNFCKQAGRPVLDFASDARRRLQAHHWPGNVRELRNLMERVAFLAQGNRIEADDLAFIISPDVRTYLEPSPDLGLTEATLEFQRDYIRRAVKRVQGNMSEAARLMGLHRSNLYRKMRQLGMKEARDDGDSD